MVTVLIIAASLVVALAAAVFLRRRSRPEEPRTVSIERRLGPTRPPLRPDQGAGSSLEFRPVRSPRPSGPLPDLPPDPWGLETDKSVAPFLAPPRREDRDEEEPPQAAQHP